MNYVAKRAAGALTCFVLASVAYGTETEALVSQLVPVHTADALSQQTINVLDDTREEALQVYLRNERMADATEAYNQQLQAMVGTQTEELKSLRAQVESLEQLDLAVLPLMSQMTEVLEKFIDQDLPFLKTERVARLERLKATLTRSDVTVAEKYRQVLEAYEIEVGYGRTIEAYIGDVSIDGKDKAQLLRLGRTALYGQSLGGDQGYLWNPKSQHWQHLSEPENQALTVAMRVASQQLTPRLLQLPLVGVSEE
ncbi:MAG: DUF3450 domain-containing protein [Pontibacterium sp.]